MEDVHEILSRAGIFQGVDPEAVDNLIEQMETVKYPRGTTIFEDGRENLLTVMGPSDMFGELSIFDPGPRTSSAICVTEVRAATMNSEMLQKWVSDHPLIAQQLLRVLARRLRRTNASLADLIFTDVPGRVAKTLLQLANRFGVQEGGALRVNHDLTQEEIAQLVGASRETVNKALATFAHRGWIRLEGKSVLIVDTEHLARRAR